MTIRFNGMGGFNESFFNQTLKQPSGGSTQEVGLNRLQAILNDKVVTRAELQSVKSAYLLEAAKLNIPEDKALQEFNKFAADILDGNLNHSHSAQALDNIVKLGSLFEGNAGLRVYQQEKPDLNFEFGRVTSEGFHTVSFPDLSSTADAPAEMVTANERQALWKACSDSLKSHVFKDKDKSRNVATNELAVRYSVAQKSQRELQGQISEMLTRLKAMPQSDKLPLSKEIQNAERMHELLGLNIQVQAALSHSNGKPASTFDSRVNPNTIAKLNEAIEALNQFEAKLGESLFDTDLKSKILGMRNTAQAVANALGDPTYVMMSTKVKPTNINPMALAMLYERHKGLVSEGRRRDVDGSPQGFVDAQVKEFGYDQAIAGQLSKLLGLLDTPMTPEKRQQTVDFIRSEIAKMLPRSVVKDGPYVQAIKKCVDAKISSQAAIAELVKFMASRQPAATQAPPTQAEQQLLQKMQAYQRAAVDNTGHRPQLDPKSLGLKDDGAVRDLLTQFQGTTDQRKQLEIVKTLLKYSEAERQASDALISKVRVGGALKETIHSTNQTTGAQNKETGDKVAKAEAALTSETTQVTSELETRWNERLSQADQAFMARLMAKCKAAPVGSNLNKLYKHFEGLSLAQDDKYKAFVDLGKLQTQMGNLMSQPDLKKVLEDLHKDLIAEYFPAGAKEQIMQTLQSDTFRQELLKLPPDQQKAKLEEKLKVLDYIDSEAANQVREDLFEAILNKQVDAVQMSPAEREVAYEKALIALLGDEANKALVPEKDEPTLIDRVEGGLDDLNDGFDKANTTGKALRVLNTKDLAKVMAGIDPKVLKAAGGADEVFKLIRDQAQKMNKGHLLNDIKYIADKIDNLGDRLDKLSKLAHLGAGHLDPESLKTMAQVMKGGTAKSKAALATLSGSTGTGGKSKGISSLTKLLNNPTVKALGKVFGPVMDVFSLKGNLEAAQQERLDGDKLGATMKDFQAGASAVSLTATILIAAGATGPGAPFVLAGAMIVGAAAWLVDEVFGKTEDQQNMGKLEKLGVLRDVNSLSQQDQQRYALYQAFDKMVEAPKPKA